MQVFISYAAKDREIARELGSALTKRGLKVWLADEQVLPGDNWSLKIGEALDRSKAMLVLLSPDAVKSELVRREIQYALSSPKYEGRVIPVIVRPTKDIPWILRKFHVTRLDREKKSRLPKQLVDLLLGGGSGEILEAILGKAKLAHS